MLVCFIFNSAHYVLEAGDIDFVIENALQVIIVYLFSQISLNFRLVCFTMQCLCYGRLVRLIRQLSFNFHDFCIDFLLKALLVTLR